MERQWNLAAQARQDFADLIESLSADQHHAQTLCNGWTVKHVLSHLVFIAEMTAARLLVNLARSGFNFDRMNDRVVVAESRSVPELVDALRSNATRPAPLPGFAEKITVADVAIHTQDIRRPLDLPGELDAEVLRTALEFVTTDKYGMKLGNIPHRAELQFVATDLDWSFGSGHLAAGPAESILMTLAGRAHNELTGDGSTSI